MNKGAKIKKIRGLSFRVLGHSFQILVFATTMFLILHVDVLCDQLLNRRTATWNLFVLYHKELKDTEKEPFYFKFRQFDRHKNSALT